MPEPGKIGGVEAPPPPAQPARTYRLWGVTLDWRITQIAVLTALLLLVDYYHPILPQSYRRFVLQFAIPAALVVALWREDLRDYGLRLGNWRLGLAISAAAIAVMAVVILLVAPRPEFRHYYIDVLAARAPGRVVLDSAFELFAWEFFCRGWLLFALGKRYGTDAIWLQAIPFALMHVYKPELEALSTVFGGALFGLLAWRTRSFLYGWLIHWFIAAWIMLVAGGFV
jgi:membrane protease YdiL (CAAX protease family)